MLYTKFLRTTKRCPFCHTGDKIFLDRKTAYLTYALAPYSRYHLLIVPKRHEVNIEKMTAQENRDINSLISTGIKIMKRLGITDYTVLVRNGGDKVKTVPHLHWHIIPKHRIGDLDQRGKRRKILTPKEIARITKTIESARG